MPEFFGVVLGVFGTIIALLIIMACFLLNGKGAFLIAGYNTMSTAKKAQYDEKALCRFTGLLLVVISFCLALFPISLYFEITWLLYCGIALIFVALIGFFIYAYTNNRFRKTDSLEIPADDNKPSTTKVAIIASIAILVIVTAVGSMLVYQGNKDPVVNILDNSIQINSMYGLNIDFSEITAIVLIEQSVSDFGRLQRTNGYGGIGNALKGHFKSDSLGNILLFVQSDSAPTIQIARSDAKDIYISFRDGEKTAQLYLDLVAAVK
jgi:uncharacterized membrane protein YidH (DUF202 family)